MAIISKEKPVSGIGGKISIYESFTQLRALPSVTPGLYYWLLNPDFNLVYFVSGDTTSPDSAPNTLVVTATGQRLKIIGSE